MERFGLWLSVFVLGIFVSTNVFAGNDWGNGNNSILVCRKGGHPNTYVIKDNTLVVIDSGMSAEYPVSVARYIFSGDPIAGYIEARFVDIIGVPSGKAHFQSILPFRIGKISGLSVLLLRDTKLKRPVDLFCEEELVDERK